MKVDYALNLSIPRTLAGARLPDLLSAGEWSRLIAALRLAPREGDVLRAGFCDERYAQIARRLGIRTNTVHTYCDRVLLKLRVGSLTQALSFVVAVHLELACQTGAGAMADVEPTSGSAASTVRSRELAHVPQHDDANGVTPMRGRDPADAERSAVVG
jgi:DNA-binding CsgD family transcriptional regulator